VKKYKFPFIKLFILLFVVGCQSVSDIVGSSDDDLELSDEVGQLLSDIQNEEEQMLDMESSSSETKELVVSEEKLDPAPTQNYDSVLLDKSEELPEEVPENVEEDVFSQKNPEEREVIINKNNFKTFETNIAKLSINDKIQYRVATINFYTGSFQVDGIGLRKIKKIAKIAKERNAKIKIVGHASKRTRDMPLAKHKLVNFNISDKRAQSVANVFIKNYDFPSNNLITEAVSDTKPLFKENMPAGTKANQRTEIFLIY